MGVIHFFIGVDGLGDQRSPKKQSLTIEISYGSRRKVMISVSQVRRESLQLLSKIFRPSTQPPPARAVTVGRLQPLRVFRTCLYVPPPVCPGLSSRCFSYCRSTHLFRNYLITFCGSSRHVTSLYHQNQTIPFD